MVFQNESVKLKNISLLVKIIHFYLPVTQTLKRLWKIKINVGQDVHNILVDVVDSISLMLKLQV